jgi:hypothetical protein
MCTIDQSFDNDLPKISFKTEKGNLDIKKGDTFKWKSYDAVPFKIANITRFNEKNEGYVYFITQNPDGAWPIDWSSHVTGKILFKDIIPYLASVERLNENVH